jgi:hypothetical protein
MFLRSIGGFSATRWRNAPEDGSLHKHLCEELTSYKNFMVLGFTQTLTGMSTRRSSRDNARPARKVDNLTLVCEATVYKVWDPQHLKSL